MKKRTFEELQEIWRLDEQRAIQNIRRFNEILEFLKENPNASIEETKQSLPHIPKQTIKHVLRILHG